MLSIPSLTAENFWECKVEYDVVTQAIKMASNLGRQDIASILTTRKETVKGHHSKALQSLTKVASSPGVNTNIHHLRGSWYVVRYVNDKNQISVSVEPLLEKDLHLIERDPCLERDLSRTDINSLMPALINEEALEQYKVSQRRGACDMLMEYGIEVDSDGCAMVSVHAARRWVQRVVGIKSESQAEDYRRSNSADVTKSVLESFNRAEVLWVGLDGCEYYFDQDNIIYVYNDNTIITLYEAEFGFDKSINRMIALSQIGIIQKMVDDLRIAEENCENTLRDIQAEFQYVVDEIKEKEAELEKLKARKNVLSSCREETMKSVELSKARFNSEFNKLFKKWEGQQ